MLELHDRILRVTVPLTQQMGIQRHTSGHDHVHLGGNEYGTTLTHQNLLHCVSHPGQPSASSYEEDKVQCRFTSFGPF
ncbi:hypothetical protein BV898_05415 [Hypsibius exemplaris]|uniref:Uncharacterized protein n=1 Tax=Hypsibius exemplaris TaxID=2072580 RepID=A0A1W0WZK3_HYPEX|nr:hypothetical protein BV898_05415 [Hypsibius exemplaris]